MTVPYPRWSQTAAPRPTVALLAVCAAAAAAAAALAVPGLAAGQQRRTPVNASPDTAALRDYRAFLTTLTVGEPDAAARDELIVDDVASDCPDALSDLARLSSDQVDHAAVTAFGQEIDADLTIAYVSTERPALARLSSGLQSLHWTGAGAPRTVRRFLAAERTFDAMDGPNLCTDARTLDAAPLSEPTSTHRFLAGYSTAAGRLHSTVDAFRALLGADATGADAKLVDAIDGLVRMFASQASATVTADGGTVLSELGLGETGASRK